MKKHKREIVKSRRTGGEENKENKHTTEQNFKGIVQIVRVAFKYPIKTIIAVGIFIIAPLLHEIQFKIDANLIWLVLILLGAYFLNKILPSRSKPLSF